MNRNLQSRPADYTAATASTDVATVNEAIRSLKHLLTLARRGKLPGSSRGEKQARALVLAILNNAIGLDSEATNGLPVLLRLVQASPQTGVELVREQIACNRRGV